MLTLLPFLIVVYARLADNARHSHNSLLQVISDPGATGSAPWPSPSEGVRRVEQVTQEEEGEEKVPPIESVIGQTVYSMSNSRTYHQHPHQQSIQAHQPHPGHPVPAPIAPYAAALQGQIPAGPQSRHVFAPPPNAQNAGQGPAAGPQAPGPMMHAAPGPQMVGQQNQQQSYQNSGPQQAIRSAFVPQGQQVPQNRPQMQQMHQQQQQVQHQQQQAAMHQMVVFPGYGQHMMYPAGAGQGQGPILSIPSASIQSINVSSFPLTFALFRVSCRPSQ